MIFSILITIFYIILLSLFIYNYRAVIFSKFKSLIEWTSPDKPFFITDNTINEVLETDLEEE